MGVPALFAWITTLAAGLVLGVMYLFEYDRDYARRTRLPARMVAPHALLGAAGLELWVARLLLGRPYGMIALGLLACAAGLGLTMVVRWLPARKAVPAERGFPRPVVIGHGIAAVTTVGLVLAVLL